MRILLPLVFLIGIALCLIPIVVLVYRYLNRLLSESELLKKVLVAALARVEASEHFDERDEYRKGVVDTVLETISLLTGNTYAYIEKRYDITGVLTTTPTPTDSELTALADRIISEKDARPPEWHKH